jgi:hypothetical protein
MYETEFIDDPLMRLIEWHTTMLVDVRAAWPAAAFPRAGEAALPSCE